MGMLTFSKDRENVCLKDNIEIDFYHLTKKNPLLSELSAIAVYRYIKGKIIWFPDTTYLLK